LPSAEEQVAAGQMAISVYDPQRHAGVQGICAARLVEKHGRPVACFSPKWGSDDRITASLRTGPGLHVRDTLAEIAATHPDDFIAWGGHAGAGGVTLKRVGLERFAAAFDASAKRAMGSWTPGPRILTDGELDVTPSLA